MKILQVIPGSGGSFYCGNCLRDSKLVDAMRRSEHEVVKIPMYLPLFAHDPKQRDVPVFYGAVSIYLKQLYPIFRHAPKWFDRLLNSGWILRMAARKAGSTNAKGLEQMTVSMLMGEEGKQHEELDRMVDWIADHFQPDVVHLSNALLLGLAPRIKSRLNTLVVCSLQDEDVWVDVMDDDYRYQVWELMQQKAAYVDAFIGVSDYYSERMREQMKIPAEKLFTVHIGVDPADYQFRLASERPGNIGFISRLCHENGLDILLDAYILLKKNKGHEEVKLILTGGHTGDDKNFLKMIRKRIAEAGLTGQVVFIDDFEGEARKAFFEQVALISVPVRQGEAFGIYLLEAMASGIPVVQPALGAFPEIIALSGGGETFEPNRPKELSRKLSDLLANPKRMDELSRKAHQGVGVHFDIFVQSARNIEVYKKLKERSLNAAST